MTDKHQDREIVPPAVADDAVDAPSGLPSEEPESTPPLGVPDPPGEERDAGPEAMPGIPTAGEPPDAG